jgi:uncharacterized protein
MDEQWQADEIACSLLLPVGVLAGEFDLTGELDADNNVIDDPTPHMQQYREMLPDIVIELDAYWAEWQHGSAACVPERSTKMRRNDPCPCGSGRKYKRCCAAKVIEAD